MMLLKTQISEINKYYALINWSIGLNSSGTLEVRNKIGFDIKDFEIVAELSAIKHLIFDARVFKRFPVSGKGYKLEVTKGAIKKLISNKSTKLHLLKYINFFNFLKGIEIETKSNKLKSHQPMGVVFPSSHVSKYEFDSDVLGKTCLTHHAVEQYDTRLKTTKPINAWNALTRKLNNKNLSKIELPEDVLEHKKRKYGISSNVEVWGILGSISRFLIINENNLRTVVTSFNGS